MFIEGVARAVALEQRLGDAAVANAFGGDVLRAVRWILARDFESDWEIVSNGRFTYHYWIMTAAQVVVRTDDGHTIFDRSTQVTLNTPRSTVVHSHVWLGNGVRVNKGAVIGTGAVLAQGSIVSSNVEPRSVCGRVTAKKLRDEVMWSRSAIYGDSQLFFR